jgi:hypothetical protein
LFWQLAWFLTCLLLDVKFQQSEFMDINHRSASKTDPSKTAFAGRANKPSFASAWPLGKFFLVSLSLALSFSSHWLYIY